MSARTPATPDLARIARLDRNIAKLRHAYLALNRKHWREVKGKRKGVYQQLTAAKERRCVALALDIERLCATRSALFAGLLGARLDGEAL